MEGNRGTVGGAPAIIRSMRKGNGLQREWEKEGVLVASIGDRETAAVQLGRNISGV